MRPTPVRALLLALLGPLSLAGAQQQQQQQAPCAPPQWNPADVPPHCSVLDTVCVDHGSMLVTHDARFHVENVRRQSTPGGPQLQWSLPVRAAGLPDALAGWVPDFVVRVRPVSKVEPTPPLRHPVWSNCTLPVVIAADYPYNLKTFVTKVLTDAHSLFRTKGVLADGSATVVLATPSGLALEAWHAELLAAFSARPPISLAELGRRGQDGVPVAWSGEGVKVECFSKMLVCKFDQRDGTAPHVAAEGVMARLEPLLPRDPLGFEAAALPSASPPLPLWQTPVLRVVIEARSAPWRSIRNAPDLLRACEEAHARGFFAGPFTGISCKLLPTTYDTSPPPAAGSAALGGTPAAAAFRSALAAVRSAHLFLAVAGSSGAHAFFMHPENGTGLLEVRPCGWGTKHAAVANEAQDAMARQLELGADAIRFFAYNLEDPAQCAPPDYEPQVRPLLAPGAAPAPPPAHQLQPRSPPRYSPEQLLARDQHLTLRPAPLLELIRAAAVLLRDKGAYQAARAAGRVQGYGTAEGVVMGPAGLQDVAAHAAQAGTQIFRA